MKKAYNETWVENINNRKIIDDWFSKKLISDEQHQEGYQAFPVGFHQSNIFVKIRLFLFTCLAASAGLFFLPHSRRIFFRISFWIFDNKFNLLCHFSLFS